jgi:hypothetical protein
MVATKCVPSQSGGTSRSPTRGGGKAFPRVMLMPSQVSARQRRGRVKRRDFSPRTGEKEKRHAARSLLRPELPDSSSVEP